MIQLTNLCAGYGTQPVLRNLSFSIPAGSVTTLIGPNGCGKTTLLRALTGALPYTGSIELCGKECHAYTRKELARTIALLPQSRNIPDLTVQTLAEHGRYPHLGMARRLSEADRRIVDRAMEQADVAPLANQPLHALSGGQRQRAYIAMALAQDTPIIALDEPATHLDLNRQFELLDLIRQLKQTGKTIILVLHDLDHALRCSDWLVLLEEGKLAQCGTPRQLLQSGRLEQVFGVKIHEMPQGFLFSTKDPTVG